MKNTIEESKPPIAIVTIEHSCSNCENTLNETLGEEYFNTVLISPPTGWMVLDDKMYCEDCYEEHMRLNGD